MRRVLIIVAITFLIISCKENDSCVTPVPIEGDGYTYAFIGNNDVESFAKSIDGTTKLISINAVNVKQTGAAKTWYYKYLSSGKMLIYNFTKTEYCIGFDSTSQMKPGAAVINDTWINSMKALTAAEENGGKDFRAKHSDCSISASLGQAVVPNSVPYWLVCYSASNEKIYFTVNAVNGQIINN